MHLFPYYVSDSKFVLEALSYYGDFQQSLQAGETIVTPSVSISLLSGIDPNPNAMKYGSISIHNGTVLEQKVRQGIAGCIYEILFTVVTSLSNTLTQQTLLAVLPLAGGSIPIFIPFYLTTGPYSIDLVELLTVTILPVESSLIRSPFTIEVISLTVLPVDSTLLGTVSYYTIIPEELSITILPIDSTLIGTQVIYTVPPEGMYVRVAPIDSTLIGTGVIYSNPHEDIKTAILPINGTLV